MAYCLIKPLADAFKQALRDGRIDPQKLANMSSKERQAFFEGIIGKADAPRVNALFEKKMLLKDMEAGMIRWAKEVTGITPDVRRGLIDRIEKLDERILNPADQKAFLESLAAKALGTEVTFEEAKAITQLSKTLTEKKGNFDKKTAAWTSEKDRLEYGAARVVLENMLEGVKDEYRGLSALQTVKKATLKGAEAIREQPVRGALQAVGSAVRGLADLSISTVASLDNSFLGRQGLSVLMTHPSSWWNGAKQSYQNLVTELRGKNAMDALRADIVSRPNAMLGRYETAGILDAFEEQYPTSFPAKIPILGRAFKASEAAFKGSAMRMRADMFDLLLKNAEANGVSVGDKVELKSYGKLVNSLTAKGQFGKPGTSEALRVVLWAPKMLKASFDVLTAHTLDYAQGNLSDAAYKEAWKNLFKIVASTATLLAIVKALKPDAVETDPTSADFGKIRIGEQRFDVTGGKAALLTLAARMLKGSFKSTTSNEIVPYGSKFGERSRFDAVLDFAVNKTTPPIHAMIDFMRGRDFEGKEPTLMGELKSLYTPIPAQSGAKFIKDPSWEHAAAFVFDFHGVSANSYANTNIKSKLIPEGKEIKNQDFISMVKVYAEAFGTDPETAFNRIFTGQRIRKVDNGTIIVERLPLEESTEIKKKGGGNNKTMKLDHTIPLQLGGSNDESNLKLVPTETHKGYTQVENHLGKLLRTGRISKKEAQELIVGFKENRISRKKILDMK